MVFDCGICLILCVGYYAVVGAFVLLLCLCCYVVCLLIVLLLSSFGFKVCWGLSLYSLLCWFVCSNFDLSLLLNGCWCNLLFAVVLMFATCCVWFVFVHWVALCSCDCYCLICYLGLFVWAVVSLWMLVVCLVFGLCGYLFVLFVLVCFECFVDFACVFLFLLCCCRLLFFVWLFVCVMLLSDGLVILWLVYPLIFTLLLVCSIDSECGYCFFFDL